MVFQIRDKRIIYLRFGRKYYLLGFLPFAVCKYLPDEAKACTKQNKTKTNNNSGENMGEYLDYILDVSYDDKIEKVMSLSFPSLPFLPFSFFLLKLHTKTRHYKENRVKINNWVKCRVCTMANSNYLLWEKYS